MAVLTLASEQREWCTLDVGQALEVGAVTSTGGDVGKRAAFSPNLYGRLARYYDAVHRTRDYEREACFVEMVLAADGASMSRRVLELFCGTGGHTIPLANRGCEVVGIDTSPDMLGIAAAKTRGRALSITFRQEDCRDLNFVGEFDVIFALGQSVHYLLTYQDLDAMLRVVKRALRPGGGFVFDVINPWRLLEPYEIEHFDVVEDGTRITRTIRTFLDQSTRVRRADIDWRIEGEEGHAMVERTCEECRIWFVDELEHALRRSGFDAVTVYGDFEVYKPLSWESVVVVLVATDAFTP